MITSYIEAITIGFPGITCHCIGDDTVYENIVWDDGFALPAKVTLDEWITSNNSLAVNTDKKITVLAFRNRFTKTEKITLELASLDNPAATMQQRQLAAAIRVDMKDSDSASFIDLSRADTRQGVFTLETYGLMATGRALVILDTPVSDLERPAK